MFRGIEERSPSEQSPKMYDFHFPISGGIAVLMVVNDFFEIWDISPLLEYSEVNFLNNS